MYNRGACCTNYDYFTGQPGCVSNVTRYECDRFGGVFWLGESCGIGGFFCPNPCTSEEAAIGANENLKTVVGNEEAIVGGKVKNEKAALEKLENEMNAKPLLVAPFDAELFGHWWFSYSVYMYRLELVSTFLRLDIVSQGFLVAFVMPSPMILP